MIFYWNWVAFVKLVIWVLNMGLIWLVWDWIGVIWVVGFDWIGGFCYSKGKIFFYFFFWNYWFLWTWWYVFWIYLFNFVVVRVSLCDLGCGFWLNSAPRRIQFLNLKVWFFLKIDWFLWNWWSGLWKSVWFCCCETELKWFGLRVLIELNWGFCRCEEQR